MKFLRSWLILLLPLLCLPAFSQFSQARKNGVMVNIPDNPFDQFRLNNTSTGQYLSIDQNGYVVGAANPASNLTQQPVTATNYPDAPSVRGGYFGANINCNQTYLPNDPGGIYVNSQCLFIQNDNDYSPGYAYGGGTLSDVGWFVHTTLGSVGGVRSYSAGIHNIIAIPYYGTGPGDINYSQCASIVRQGWLFGSDEGFHCHRDFVQEASPYIGAVATGFAGAQTLTLNCTSSCSAMGLNTPLIDMTTGVRTGSVSGCTVVGPGNVTSCSISGYTVPVSTQGTLAADVDVPRTVTNTTGQLSAASVTVNINTTVAATSATLISIIGPAFYEVVKPSSVGALSGGVQSITAVFHYSHTSGTSICIGGAVGDYLEQTSATVGTYRYLENVVCSTAAGTILVGHQSATGMSIGPTSANVVPSGSVVEYKGAEVYGVLDASGNPSNGVVNIGPNAAAWTQGDVVENANSISAIYNLMFENSDVKNPYAERVTHVETWNGLGATLNGVSNGAKQLQNPNAASNYKGLGGTLTPPWVMQIHGPWANGLTYDYWPAHSGGPIGSDPGCLGFIICAQGVRPGATSTLQDIVGPDPNNQPSSYFSYDHASQNWLLGSGGTGGLVVNRIYGGTSGNTGLTFVGGSGTTSSLTYVPSSSLPYSGIYCALAGGAGTTTGSTRCTITATTDANGYFNPAGEELVVRNAGNNTNQAVLEDAVEGCVNSSGVYFLGGACPVSAFHAYRYHYSVTGGTNFGIEDTQFNPTNDIAANAQKNIWVPTYISGAEASHTGTFKTGTLFSPFTYVATGAAAAISPQTLYTTTANSLWEVVLSGQCTSVTASATFTIQLGYTTTENNATGTSVTGACTTNGAASSPALTAYLNLKSGTAIGVATTISGSPTYDVRVVARQLTAN